MRSSNTSEPSRQIVAQRIRNRIIDYFELASSFDKQLEYEHAAPIHVPHEIINQWEDWNPESIANVGEPVFESHESEAIAAFSRIWNQVAEATPNPLPPLRELQQSSQWNVLRGAAEVALLVFLKRGRFPEEVEI